MHEPFAYRRPQAAELARRLAEPRRHLHVVAGPRQVGKSTLVQQVVERLDVPVRYASADEPTLRGAGWIEQQWAAARLEAPAGRGGSLLVLDEIQKIWGRLTESAVGAHLANAEVAGDCTVSYWREGNHEVDFVVQSGRRVVAIEVKSGRAPLTHPGMAAFARSFKAHRTLLVGGDGIRVDDFLARPVAHWVAP